MAYHLYCHLIVSALPPFPFLIHDSDSGSSFTMSGFYHRSDQESSIVNSRYQLVDCGMWWHLHWPSRYRCQYRQSNTIIVFVLLILARYSSNLQRWVHGSCKLRLDGGLKVVGGGLWPLPSKPWQPAHGSHAQHGGLRFWRLRHFIYFFWAPPQPRAAWLATLPMAATRSSEIFAFEGYGIFFLSPPSAQGSVASHAAHGRPAQLGGLRFWRLYYRAGLRWFPFLCWGTRGGCGGGLAGLARTVTDISIWYDDSDDSYWFVT
jgi:hypothetical protein